MKALSCLSSSQSKHGKHYLNERRKILAFWAQFIKDNGEQDDVSLDVMPCFYRKRFLIRGEVSFYAAARMRMIMTYISELRIEDPNVETNLLIKKTWLLNGVIEQSQILAWAVQFGSVDCLMRYLIQKDEFVALHEKRDIMQLQMEATHKLGEGTPKVLSSCTEMCWSTWIRPGARSSSAFGIRFMSPVLLFSGAPSQENFATMSRNICKRAQTKQ